jgi:hypothetical protein
MLRFKKSSIIGIQYAPIQASVESIFVKNNSESNTSFEAKEEPSSDTLFFIQYLLRMYVRIFSLMSPDINSLITCIEEHDRLTDPYLSELINRDSTDTEAIEKLSLRLNAYRYIDKSIIETVLAAYSRSKLYSFKDVQLYHIRFENNPKMPVVLYPSIKVDLDNKKAIEFIIPRRIENEPFWNILFSIERFYTHISVYEKLLCLAQLAAPLPPVYVTHDATSINSNRYEEGVPLSNIAAMMIRDVRTNPYSLEENESGYNLSANLKNNINHFFGAGSFCCHNYLLAKEFIKIICDTSNKESNKMYARTISKIEDYFHINISNKSTLVPSTEATKNNDDDDFDTGKFTGDPKKKKKDKNADKPDEDSDGGLDNKNKKPGEEDADDLDNPNDTFEEDDATKTGLNEDDDGGLSNNTENNTEDNQGSDDIIASTADKDHTVGSIIPLAGADETTNDHLYRLAVLNYTTQCITKAASDVSPNVVETLRMWCNRWLFLASTKCTRKLLTQLKVTGLKEFRP